MKRDDDLGREILQAYRRQRPGDDFDREVMERLADGGGEHEISGANPGSRRALGKALAAAALLLLVGWVLLRAFGGKPADRPGDGVGPAEGAYDLAVDVDERGGYRIGDREASPAELASVLATAASANPEGDGAGPSDPTLLVRARPATPWGRVSGVLRAAMRAKLGHLSVGAPGEAPVAVAAPDEPGSGAWVMYLRGSKRDGTLVTTGGREATAPLDAALPGLTAVFEAIGKSGVRLSVELRAADDVPFADVLRVARAACDAGLSPIRVGDPSAPAPDSPAPNRPIPADLLAPVDVQLAPLKEEVRPDIAETKPVAPEERAIVDPVIRDAPAK